MKLTPRPHQIEASSNIHQALLSSDRTRITQACGTGKTLVQTMLTDIANGQHIVIFAPTLLLVNQILNTWVEQTDFNLNQFVVVCSNKHTGEVDDIESDEITLVHVAKNQEEAELFIQKDSIQKIVLSTYNSAPLLHRMVFGLGIFDEAHKTVGELSRLYSYALDNKNINIQKRIYMTATEKTAKHKYLSVASMTDTGIYGDKSYDLSFRKAINAGLILDYQILVTAITQNDLSEEMLKSINDNGVSLMHYANAIAVSKVIERYNIDKIISFHGLIYNALVFKDVVKAFNPTLNTVHISSEQNKKDRSVNMAAFRLNGKSLATNARCLTEGIDVPDVDAVLFADPKDSTIDIVQAAGRAMRIHGNKKKGYIILPIYLETYTKKDLSEAIQSNNFELVWNVLSSLQDVDEALSIKLKQIQQSIGRKASNVDLGEFLTVISGGDIDEQAFLKAISIEAAEYLIEGFEYRIGQLDTYVEKYGHGYVSMEYEDQNFAYWANWMRSAHRCHQLPLYKINTLIEHGFIFNLNDKIWEDSFKLYKDARKQVNSDLDIADPNVKKWLSHQKQKHKKGELSEFRLNKLKSSGFAYRSNHDIWLEGYDKLLDELKQIKSLSAFTKSHASYEWLRIQRIRWDKLSEDKKQLLLDLGWNEYINALGRWKA